MEIIKKGVYVNGQLEGMGTWENANINMLTYTWFNGDKYVGEYKKKDFW